MTDSNQMGDELTISRRRALEAFGVSTVTLSGTAAAGSKNALRTWDCSYDCPQEEVITEVLEIPDTVDYEREGTVSIHWRGSSYDSERNSWRHVFSVSGGAASETHWLMGGEIYGQRYQLETSDGDIQPSTQSSRHGQYPCDDEDELIPDWGQPLMEAAIGTLHVGASWFLAVNESLREVMGHRPEGFSLFGGGFEYGDMATSMTSPSAWGECGYFHRVSFETHFFNTEVDVEMGFCDHDSAGATGWQQLEGTLEFFGESGPEYPASRTPHPEELPEDVWEKYGIKDVRDEPASTRREGRHSSVDFIATKSPLSMTEFEVTQKQEANMDDPYSERYRD